MLANHPPGSRQIGAQTPSENPLAHLRRRHAEFSDGRSGARAGGREDRVGGGQQRGKALGGAVGDPQRDL
jgi:hypothetical protein